MRGQYIEPLTEDMKEKFLEYVANGYTRPEAAAALDSSARVFRSLCNPQSHRYDDKFAKEYARITEPEGEHHAGLVERLRAAGLERALRSSDRLLEKYSIIHDPEWAVHKPQAMQINFNKTEQLAVILPEMSDDEILELRQRIESNMRGLPAGPPDIDADPA
jgi:hypothetical protein